MELQSATWTCMSYHILLSSGLRESCVFPGARAYTPAPRTSGPRTRGLQGHQNHLCKGIHSIRCLLCILSALKQDISENQFPFKSTTYVFHCGNRCQRSAKVPPFPCGGGTVISHQSHGQPLTLTSANSKKIHGF